MIVYVTDLSKVKGFSSNGGYCRRGGRLWFAAHGLDWDDFRKNGIDAERLRSTNDAFALKLLSTLEQEDGR